MADSLLLNSLELIGTTTNPEYRVGVGLDFGQAEPDVTQIASALLDGEWQSGERYKNRTHQLTVMVNATGATSQAIRTALTLYCDTLIAAVAATSFTLTWTPDGGMPAVADCMRGTGRRRRSIVTDNQGVTWVDLSFTSGPFFRSTDRQAITAALAPTVIDTFDTAPTGATLDTTTKYEGTGSAAVTLSRYHTLTWGYHTTAPFPSRTISPLNLSTAASVTLRVLWTPPAPTGYSPTTPYNWPLALNLTLGSAAGSAMFTATTTFSSNDTLWRLVSFPLTGGVGTLDLSAVTSWTLEIHTTSGPSASSGLPSTSVCNIDSMKGMPPSSAGIIGTNASLLNVPGVQGSARTPVRLAASKSGGGTLTSILLHSPPIDQDPDAAILIPLGGVGSGAFSIPRANANLRGTFSVILTNQGTGTGASSVTASIQQWVNGSAVGSPTVLTLPYTAPIAGKILRLGDVVFPIVDVPDDNSTTSYVITLTQSSGTDTYADLALCDSRGETVIAIAPAASTFIYVDEPDPVSGLGKVLATGLDRTAAYSILSASPIASPILFEPGTNKILAASPDGTPSITASFYPRWLDERVI